MSHPPDENDNDPKVWAEIIEANIGRVDTYTPVTKSFAERALSQKLWLRWTIAAVVVVTLWAELICAYCIILWQGRGHFQLQEWVFGSIVTGVLIQTFLGFRTIIAHLFPVEGGKLPSDGSNGANGTKK